MNSKPKRRTTLTFLSIVLGFFVFLFISTFSSFSIGSIIYQKSDLATPASVVLAAPPEAQSLDQLSVPKVIVTHIKTPQPVKAAYMSSWVAGTKNVREKLVNRLENTQFNAVVLDIKDASGKIVIKLNAPALAKYDSFDSRVPDIVEFIDELHQKGFYVIGRISVFQDDYLARRRPDLALRRKDNNEIWVDKKNIAWLDVSSPEVWDYAVAVAKEAYAAGFDELNFDYIRFPSDGDVSKIRYRHFDLATKTKAEAMREFYKYLHDQMQDVGAPISGNIFGMVTTNPDDLNIGQVLENVAPYFDFISPMVYPSHYPVGFHNFKNPASVPYEIVKISLDSAALRLKAEGISPKKIRPWLQDFDLGAVYTADMIKAQHKAVYDAGLDSWMMWDPSNKYTISAYQKGGN